MSVYVSVGVREEGVCVCVCVCVGTCRSACASIFKKACVRACSVTSKGPAALGFAMCPESFDTSRCIIKTLPHLLARRESRQVSHCGAH